MPRTTNIPTQLYAAGTYGPFGVDQLTNANTDALLLTLTAPGGWPTADPMLQVSMSWDTAPPTVWNDVIPGPQANNTLTWRLGVPKDATSKKQIASGSITLTLYVPVNVGGTLQAV